MTTQYQHRTTRHQRAHPDNSAPTSYDVSSAALGSLNLSGGPLSGFINVASNPPSPNQGQATLEVEAEQDELAGTTLTVVLDASRGTLRF